MPKTSDLAASAVSHASCQFKAVDEDVAALTAGVEKLGVAPADFSLANLSQHFDEVLQRVYFKICCGYKVVPI